MAIEATTAAAIGKIIAHDATHAGDRWWTVWSADPWLLLPAAIAVTLYLRGLRRWEERSRHHSRWRSASYLAGVATIVLVIESPLDYLGDHHFSLHMVQHEVLMMLGIPLVLLGAPTTPTLLGMPRAVRRHVVRPLMRSTAARGCYRLVTQPVFVIVIFNLTLWAWHLAPGWYERALLDDAAHVLQHSSMLLVAMLVWWNVIDPKPLQARMGYLVRMGFLLAVSTPKHFLAAFITFADEPLYPLYAVVETVFAISPAQDQELGGVLMWVPSQMMHLLAMAAVFFVWAHKSEQAQRAQEAAADAASGRTSALA